MSSSSSSNDLTVTGDNQSTLECNEWKNKTPFLYDFIISHSLISHSNTVDWASLSPRPLTQEPSLSHHTLLPNTYNSTTSSSFLTIADVSVPINDDPLSIIPKVLIIIGPLCVSRTNLYYVLCRNVLIFCRLM